MVELEKQNTQAKREPRPNLDMQNQKPFAIAKVDLDANAACEMQEQTVITRLTIVMKQAI